MGLKVPIMPILSLGFADAATSGKKQYRAPEVPKFTSSKLHPVARAKKENGGTIVWIRPFDLRIYDNPALLHAASQERPVHIVFVWSAEEDAAEGKWRTSGTAASIWLHHALAALDYDYSRWYGHRINFVLGKSTLAGL